MNVMEMPDQGKELSLEEKYPIIKGLLDEAERIGYKGDDEMNIIVVGAIQGFREVGEIKSFSEQLVSYLAEKNGMNEKVVAARVMDYLKSAIDEMDSTASAHPEKERDAKIAKAWKEAIPELE